MYNTKPIIMERQLRINSFNKTRFLRNKFYKWGYHYQYIVQYKELFCVEYHVSVGHNVLKEINNSWRLRSVVEHY